MESIDTTTVAGTKSHVEAIDLWAGSLVFLLEFALFWVTNSKAFEGVVLVVSWINCLTTWAMFLWGARSRGARFAFPRFVLPNQQPYGRGVDYFDKYAAIGLVIFSTVQMFVKFSGLKFSAALILSSGILCTKWSIERQKRRSD
ncbi:hypothetical protein CJ030_MR1G008827 [Morella rubra]|uniref:Uncharacterized protein n=1 Tax=Morella rubra TaxID=262757 RepID=A0A6A1WHT4_9ROSI|nr:hypothetical protein CJ030_MR1G008827 [Morella rubra]